MQTVLEKNALLERAERLCAGGRYEALRTMIATLPQAHLRHYPELQYYRALAEFRTARKQAALLRLERMECLPTHSLSPKIHRKRLNLHGGLLIELGMIDRGEFLLNQAASEATYANDQQILADATANLGVIMDIRCDWTAAVAAFERAISAYHRLGNTYAVAGCHNNLALSYRQVGSLTKASSHLDQALELFRQFPPGEDLLGALTERAVIRFVEGDLAFAHKAAELVRTAAVGCRSRRMESEALRVLGMIFLRQTRLPDALAVLEKGLRLAKEEGVVMLQAETHEEMAEVCALSGNSPDSAAHLSAAASFFRGLGAERRATRAEARVLGLNVAPTG